MRLPGMQGLISRCVIRKLTSSLTSPLVPAATTFMEVNNKRSRRAVSKVARLLDHGLASQTQPEAPAPASAPAPATPSTAPAPQKRTRRAASKPAVLSEAVTTSVGPIVPVTSSPLPTSALSQLGHGVESSPTPQKRSRRKQAVLSESVTTSVGPITSSPLTTKSALSQPGHAGAEPLLRLGPLIAGTLVKRPSAVIKTPYVADVQLLDGQATMDSDAPATVLAHCPGMDCAGIMVPGSRVYMTSNMKADGTTSTRTSHTVQMVEDVRHGTGDPVLVGAHPSLAEKLTKEAATRGLLAGLLGEHVNLETQKTFGATRVDFVLHHEDGSRTLLEVKNAICADFLEGVVPADRHKKCIRTSSAPLDGTPWAPTALFPVGKSGHKPGIKVVSDRAIKHVHELTQLQLQLGGDGPVTRCAVLFVVNRSDCQFFRPCDESDLLFANVVKHAHEQGVKVLAHDVTMSATSGDVYWGKPLPVVFRECVTGVIDMEHLEKVLHFNQTDPSKKWKKLKADKARALEASQQEQEQEEEEQLPTPAKATPKGKAKGKQIKAKQTKRRKKQESTEEEESSPTTTSDESG